MKAGVPCRKCAGVAFCSTFCRDESEESYHQYECEFQEVLTGLGCSQVARLALRMITIKPFQYFLNIKDQLISVAALGQEEMTNRSSNEYLRVYNLVGLTKKRWAEEHVIRCSLAIILLSILRASGYFGTKKSSTSGDSFSPNELFFGSLLLRNLQILQFNAHEVYEMMRGSKSNLKPSKNFVIALAIYPSASYFNHSCHAGVSRCFRGKEMILKTLHPILEGQEVSENYGYAFYLKSKNDRKKELSARYWFDCECKACKEKWPLLDNMASSPPSNDVDVQKQYDAATRLMEEGKAAEAMECLATYLDHYYTEEKGGNVKMCQEIVRAEDNIRT